MGVLLLVLLISDEYIFFYYAEDSLMTCIAGQVIESNYHEGHAHVKYLKQFSLPDNPTPILSLA